MRRGAEGSGLSSPGAQAPRWAMTHTREVAGGRVRLCANHAIQQHLATQHSWGARQQLPAPSPSLCPRGLWAGGGARAPLSTAGLSVGARSGPSVRPTPLPQPVCSPGLAAGDPGVLERGARQDGGRTGGPAWTQRGCPQAGLRREPSERGQAATPSAERGAEQTLRRERGQTCASTDPPPPAASRLARCSGQTQGPLHRGPRGANGLGSPPVWHRGSTWRQDQREPRCL